MANKVDANRNENTYNPQQDFLTNPAHLPKSKHKAKQRGGNHSQHS